LQYFAAQTSTTTVTERTPDVRERVKVIPLRQNASHLLTGTDSWGWSELRDYVVREIEARHGQQPSDPRKEASIFKSFLNRFPDGQAIRIARAAFEIYDGWWANAPISVNRFCKGSDEYFATPILAKLER
jgi:hypothetical protein